MVSRSQWMNAISKQQRGLHILLAIVQFLLLLTYI